jgi:hypothetical protein
MFDNESSDTDDKGVGAKPLTVFTNRYVGERYTGIYNVSENILICSSVNDAG